MIPRRAFAVLLFVLPLVAGCSDPENVYRYRLTVEVETPQGVKTGAGVREVTFHPKGNSRFAIGESRSQISLRGEAVAVDVAPGKTLFALLNGADGESDWATRIADRAIVDAEGVGWDRTPRTVELWPTYPDAVKLKRTSPLPLLVTFTDLRDPKTVTRVAPDALEARFGTGVKLKRITVQVTEDDVTTGIEGRLGWLPKVYEFDFGQNFHPDGVPVGDFQRLFSTEFSK